MNHTRTVFYYLSLFCLSSCLGLDEHEKHGSLVYDDPETAATFNAARINDKFEIIRAHVVSNMQQLSDGFTLTKTMYERECPYLSRVDDPSVRTLREKGDAYGVFDPVIQDNGPSKRITRIGRHPQHPFVFYSLPEGGLVHMWVHDRKTLLNYFSELGESTYAQTMVLFLLLKQHKQKQSACVEEAVDAMNAALDTHGEPTLVTMGDFAATQRTLPPIIATTINRALDVRARKSERPPPADPTVESPTHSLEHDVAELDEVETPSEPSPQILEPPRNVLSVCLTTHCAIL